MQGIQIQLGDRRTERELETFKEAKKKKIKDGLSPRAPKIQVKVSLHLAFCVLYPCSCNLIPTDNRSGSGHCHYPGFTFPGLCRHQAPHMSWSPTSHLAPAGLVLAASKNLSGLGHERLRPGRAPVPAALGKTQVIKFTCLPPQSHILPGPSDSGYRPLLSISLSGPGGDEVSLLAPPAHLWPLSSDHSSPTQREIND